MSIPGKDWFCTSCYACGDHCGCPMDEQAWVIAVMWKSSECEECEKEKHGERKTESL